MPLVVSGTKSYLGPCFQSHPTGAHFPIRDKVIMETCFVPQLLSVSAQQLSQDCADTNFISYLSYSEFSCLVSLQCSLYRSTARVHERKVNETACLPQPKAVAEPGRGGAHL